MCDLRCDLLGDSAFPTGSNRVLVILGPDYVSAVFQRVRLKNAVLAPGLIQGGLGADTALSIKPRCAVESRKINQGATVGRRPGLGPGGAGWVPNSKTPADANRRAF
jgi:hypothetical protein